MKFWRIGDFLFPRSRHVAYRRAVDAHISEVREVVIPRLQIDRFPDANRLIARFDSIVADWERRSESTDDSAIRECVNELCVARLLLEEPELSAGRLLYEPKTKSGKSIDFQMAMPISDHYFDVKTVRPRDPHEPMEKWKKYLLAQQNFPKNANMHLEENWMGGELWHYNSSARARFLEHAVALEEKISEMERIGGREADFRLVYCGEGFRWHISLLEDFADFYRTGSFRADDPLRDLQAHHIAKKGIVLRQTIAGFCCVMRPSDSVVPKLTRGDVRGPKFGGLF